MRKYLVSRGWSSFDAETLKEKLRVADYSLNPREHLPDRPKDRSVTDWSAAASPSEEVVISEENVALLPAEVPAPEAELVCAFEKALEADRAPAVPVQGYVISVTRGGRHRKLHHVGSCRCVPGVDHNEFEVYGDVMPSNAEVDSRCTWCFGRGLVCETAPVEEESGAESLDSSSSSTVEKPAAKKARKLLIKCKCCITSTWVSLISFGVPTIGLA